MAKQDKNKQPQRSLGYAIANENQGSLNAHGIEPKLMMSRFGDHFPKLNHKADPDKMIKVLNQGAVGACQGFSLALAFQVCFFLATRRIINFSSMCGYIISQKYDGLIGRDVGSTLSGGQRTATEHGLCLEEDWPYPGRYISKIPQVQFPFKLQSAKPTNDPQLIMEALEMGLPVQTGMMWNDELEQEVVTSYTGRRAMGGHATLLWLCKESGNIRHHNSWGRGWNGDGRSEWTPRALEQIVTYRDNTFVIYAPDGAQFPDLDPISPAD